MICSFGIYLFEIGKTVLGLIQLLIVFCYILSRLSQGMWSIFLTERVVLQHCKRSRGLHLGWRGRRVKWRVLAFQGLLFNRKIHNNYTLITRKLFHEKLNSYRNHQFLNSLIYLLKFCFTFSTTSASFSLSKSPFLKYEM